MPNTAKTNEIKELTPQQLRRMGLHKALSLAFLVVFAAPGLLMHAAYMDITIKQYIIYLAYFSLTFPMFAGVFYWIVSYSHRCPQCKKFWTFRKVKEQFIQPVKQGREFGEFFICSACGYEQVHKSIRKRGKKQDD